ncbi:MAG: DUF4258 domain-containing protein [Chitinophagaceae bacterium]|nr:DUF4258 domain-containing protein [Chitinophagaceae bacterium]
MNFKKIAPFLFLIILAGIALYINNNGSENVAPKTTTTTPKSGPKQKTKLATTNRGLNRNPSKINYTKHAKCRMACRHIDEREVKELIKDGKVNYKKSELDKGDCEKKYAIEAYTKVQNQHIRLVVAPCADELTIITCIDLDKEWACECD